MKACGATQTNSTKLSRKTWRGGEQIPPPPAFLWLKYYTMALILYAIYIYLPIYIYGLCLFVQELLPQFSPKSSQIFCEHSTSPGIETVGFH